VCKSAVVFGVESGYAFYNPLTSHRAPEHQSNLARGHPIKFKSDDVNVGYDRHEDGRRLVFFEHPTGFATAATGPHHIELLNIVITALVSDYDQNTTDGRAKFIYLRSNATKAAVDGVRNCVCIINIHKRT
jgi:hypothetical protein